MRRPEHSLLGAVARATTLCVCGHLVQSPLASRWGRHESHAFPPPSLPCRLLSRLSDAELAKALGYGNRAGRHLAKAAQYHGGDFARSKAALLSFLRC